MSYDTTLVNAAELLAELTHRAPEPSTPAELLESTLERAEALLTALSTACQYGPPEVIDSDVLQANLETITLDVRDAQVLLDFMTRVPTPGGTGFFVRCAGGR